MPQLDFMDTYAQSCKSSIRLKRATLQHLEILAHIHVAILVIHLDELLLRPISFDTAFLDLGFVFGRHGRFEGSLMVYLSRHSCRT